MSYATLSQIEQSVARIVVALGQSQDWKSMPCSLQLLALGLLAADMPDADFTRLLERAEKYEEENPVLGFTAFSVYAHLYLAMSARHWQNSTRDTYSRAYRSPRLPS